MEPMAGIEPATDGLRNRCSTTELHWPRKFAEGVGSGTPSVDSKAEHMLERLNRRGKFIPVPTNARGSSREKLSARKSGIKDRGFKSSAAVQPDPQPKIGRNALRKSHSSVF